MTPIYFKGLLNAARAEHAGQSWLLQGACLRLAHRLLGLMLSPYVAACSHCPPPEFQPCNLSIMKATFASFICKSLVSLRRLWKIGVSTRHARELKIMPEKNVNSPNWICSVDPSPQQLDQYKLQNKNKKPSSLISGLLSRSRSRHGVPTGEDNCLTFHLKSLKRTESSKLSCLQII